MCLTLITKNQSIKFYTLYQANLAILGSLKGTFFWNLETRVLTEIPWQVRACYETMQIPKHSLPSSHLINFELRPAERYSRAVKEKLAVAMTAKRNIRTDSCDAELRVLETTLQPEKILDAQEKQTEEEEEFNDEEVWESDDQSETDLGINAKLCEICSKVDLHGAFFRSTRWDQDPLPLGALDDIFDKTLRPSKCGLCRLVYHLVYQTRENFMTLCLHGNDQKLRLRLIREGRIQVLGSNHLYGEILLLHEDASFLDPAPLSRLVGKGEADIALLRSWIKDCDDITLSWLELAKEDSLSG